MFNKFKAIKKKRFWQSGQGTSEYALILVLVAVVTILAVGLVGDEIKNQFCAISASIPGTPDLEVCQLTTEEAEEEEEEENPVQVVCVGLNGLTNGSTIHQSQGVQVRAIVNGDSDPSSISHVDFYVGGHKISPAEYTPQYCLKADNVCSHASYHMPHTGTQTIQAIAYDKSGNSGQCSMTINVIH